MIKQIKNVALVLCASIPLLAADTAIDMPSSQPIDVFKMKKGQVGIGYMQFNVELSLEDEYYEDKIGDVNYDNKGIIITLPADSKTIIGEMFEESYTVGIIDSELEKKHFVDGAYTYDNKYDKSGFYIGYRPSFSTTFYESDMFRVSNATSLHMILYTLNGDFTVDGTKTGFAYSYDETSFGFGLKPTTVINTTFFPIDNLGISIFGGASTFFALDINDYENKTNPSDYDTEVNGYMADIAPIYGFDIIFKGIVGDDDSFNLSSVFAKKDNDTSTETIVRYIYNF
ncbi:hypothetical protein [Sulfurimonas sp.]|uniref:hypothetical protein n=1 Tax=Sulfurimonas sp. TaxID=2022749 RepID=UPI003564069C